MSEFQDYIKTIPQSMRPYVPGESLEGISVSNEDIPGAGGMIAQNPENPNDQWYISKSFFEENYVLAMDPARPDGSTTITTTDLCGVIDDGRPEKFRTIHLFEVVQGIELEIVERNLFEETLARYQDIFTDEDKGDFLEYVAMKAAKGRYILVNPTVGYITIEGVHVGEDLDIPFSGINVTRRFRLE